MTMRFDELFFHAPATVSVSALYEDGRPKSGALKIGQETYPIREGVVRLVDDDGYASNFGLQWNIFKTTQFDSALGLPITFNRFWNNTRWKPRDIFGKTVLEIGSGAGRFTEILLEAGAKVVSVDLSSAVDANWTSNRGKGDLLLFQGSIYDMPFEGEQFDFVFCYGVLQHTPDPQRAFDELWKYVKPGGKLAIDYYLKTSRLEWWNQPKYFWRPYALKMKPEKLLDVIRAYIPWWLPIDTRIKRLPKIGRALGTLTMIPCWNYYFLPLTKEQRREWAIMDTFDALGAQYDQPKTLEEVRAMVTKRDADSIEVFYGSNGVAANVDKAEKPAGC